MPGDGTLMSPTIARRRAGRHPEVWLVNDIAFRGLALSPR
jgi:hypothetical protein